MSSIGDIVLYTLDAADAAHVNQWRQNFERFNNGQSGHKHPHNPGAATGERLSSGHMAHVGVTVSAGDQFAAVVSAVPDPPRLNLRVLLDGCDTLWATSVPEGEETGCWLPKP